MKVYVDDNEDYRITYSSRDGSECLESMGMQPIIVENLSDHTKQVRKELLQEIDYGAIRKMAERPDNLCYKDALYEYFLDQIQNKGE